MGNNMKLTTQFIALVSLTFSLSVLATSQSTQYTPESTKLLVKLQDQVKATLLAISDNEKRAGKNMQDFHYSHSVPAQQVTYLGLVLELDNAQNGYQVLSVTPGSAADKLSIKSKDYILEINDIKISNSTTENAVKLLNDLEPGDNLKLTVKTGENEREVSTKLIGQFIPEIKLELGSNNEMASIPVKNSNNHINSKALCGKVSISQKTPTANNIYRATIKNIDDNHLIRNRNSVKLSIGKHKIYLHENIGIKNFNAKFRSTKAKSIEIDVKRNTTYHLGAKFNQDKKFTKRNGAYWTPIVWSTSSQECKFN
jgi:hypothetical protein